MDERREIRKALPCGLWKRHSLLWRVLRRLNELHGWNISRAVGEDRAHLDPTRVVRRPCWPAVDRRARNSPFRSRAQPSRLIKIDEQETDIRIDRDIAEALEYPVPVVGRKEDFVWRGNADKPGHPPLVRQSGRPSESAVAKKKKAQLSINTLSSSLNCTRELVEPICMTLKLILQTPMAVHDIEVTAPPGNGRRASSRLSAGTRATLLFPSEHGKRYRARRIVRNATKSLPIRRHRRVVRTSGFNGRSEFGIRGGTIHDRTERLNPPAEHR